MLRSDAPSWRNRDVWAISLSAFFAGVVTGVAFRWIFLATIAALIASTVALSRARTGRLALPGRPEARTARSQPGGRTYVAVAFRSWLSCLSL